MPLQISALDNTNVEPLAKLTITGTGFDPSAEQTVSFLVDDDFSFDVPVMEATTSTISVAVAPYINIATGDFEAGTVSVRVLKNTAAGVVTSNTIPAPPFSTCPQGTTPNRQFKL